MRADLPGELQQPVPYRLLSPYQLVGTDHKSAALKLQDAKLCRTVEHRNNLARESWENVQPDLVKFYRRFRQALMRMKWPLYAFTMYRDHEAQALLWRHGATRNRPGQSPHQYGAAIDLAHTYRFQNLDWVYWDLINGLAQETARKCKVKIQWGGEMPGEAPSHWQLCNWQDYAPRPSAQT